ncbi:type II toxin-antitoxin system RelB/DinJ family antitoxin [Clostridiales bacterium COT073_COT-073]|nr:type II toxin-antitoxin system RelB/DinJ family antitoxin [Clostridiales bacterium COT073_COT-073]
MAQVNLRVDDEVKRDVELILDEIGLSMSAAINVFLKRVAREGKIPFELSADPFYSERNITRLKRAIANVESGQSTLKEHNLIEVDDD